MTTIVIGKVNDCTVYAVNNGYGRLIPLSENDLKFCNPDYAIKCDSGCYPISDFEQYICDKASDYI